MIDEMPDIFISNPDGRFHREKANPSETTAEKKTGPPSARQGRTISLFSSYFLNPRIFFRDLNENEEILLFLRRHFVTNVPWIIQGIFLIILPILTGILINSLGISTTLISPNLYLFILLFYYLFVFEFFFLNFINWFYNISLVTNQRVIDFDFRVLFSKQVAATKIVQIEDVSLNEVGLIRSVFDYGDVKIQTAGTVEFFEFLAVPHPEKVVHVISDLIGEQNVP